MTPHEVKGLLAALVALDYRHRTADETSAEAKELVWSQMLAEVDPQWCFDYIKRKHAEERRYPLEAPTIVGAWRNEVSYRERMSRPPEPDVRPSPDRIAEIRKGAGLKPYTEPKRKRGSA